MEDGRAKIVMDHSKYTQIEGIKWPCPPAALYQGEQYFSYSTFPQISGAGVGPMPRIDWQREVGLPG